MSSGLAGARHRATLALCLAIVYVVWGSSYLVTRIAVHDLPPFLMGGLRFTIGGTLLYGLAHALGRASGTLDRAELGRVLAVGLGCVLVSNACNAWSLQWITSNQSALLNVSAAFWIVFFGAFGHRAHPVGWRIAIGLAAGFAGTALLIAPAPELEPAAAAALAPAGAPPAASGRALLPPATPRESPWGALVPELVTIVGCIGWAFGTVWMRKHPTRLDLLSFTGLQMLAGGLMLLALGFATGEAARWTWSPSGLLAVAWLIVFSSGIAYAAYGWLSQHATPAQVGSYAFVNPALATLLGWAVLGERLSPLQWSGMIVVLGSLAVIHVSRSPRGTAPPD